MRADAAADQVTRAAERRPPPRRQLDRRRRPIPALAFLPGSRLLQTNCRERWGMPLWSTLLSTSDARPMTTADSSSRSRGKFPASICGGSTMRRSEGGAPCVFAWKVPCIDLVGDHPASLRAGRSLRLGELMHGSSLGRSAGGRVNGQRKVDSGGGGSLQSGGVARGRRIDNPAACFFIWEVEQDETFYRGTSLTRKRTPLGPYRRPMPMVLGVLGGWAFSYGRGTPACLEWRVVSYDPA